MNIKCNTVEYWEPLIASHKTLKGRIFENERLTDNTMYIHYVIFNKKSGIESVWAPIPDLKKMIGFINYCFLPEAYYKWIEGKDKAITQVPTLSLDKILKDAIKNKKITKIEEKHMKGDIEAVKRFWQEYDGKVLKDIKRFCSRFNTNWIGDSNEFLYLKVFNNAIELGEFVLNTISQTNYEEEFEVNFLLSSEEWMNLCKTAHKSKENEEKFKSILFKELTEII